MRPVEKVLQEFPWLWAVSSTWGWLDTITVKTATLELLTKPSTGQQIWVNCWLYNYVWTERASKSSRYIDPNIGAKAICAAQFGKESSAYIRGIAIIVKKPVNIGEVLKNDCLVLRCKKSGQLNALCQAACDDLKQEPQSQHLF